MIPGFYGDDVYGVLMEIRAWIEEHAMTAEEVGEAVVVDANKLDEYLEQLQLENG